ncbi:hypothetical protein [uncultured Brevundimonas sp.]|uniref:hypothetical protein n=1 Tax=uncultured Brevundimonas sp. TaxID=213418 RepID=UPI0025D1F401|nr:hypothetical protein [uncultured Brevundimonas sp.]
MTDQNDPAAAEKAAAEKAEADRVAAEKAKADRVAAEKAEADRVAAEKAEADRAAAAKAAAPKRGRQSHRPDPIAKADPTPRPLSSDVRQPAAPRPDPSVQAQGSDPKKDTDAPTGKADAIKEPGGVAIIWVQPGHETFGIGQMITVPAKQAEELRGAGRARYASEAEVAAAGDADQAVAGV